jgi:hypothetical protein
MSKSVFANPSLRAHLFWVTTCFTAGLLLTIAVAVFVPLFQRFDASVQSYEAMGALAQHILDLHTAFWPVVFVALCSTAVCSWALYARMRGPLFRFVAAFRAIREGRTPEAVTIRASDYVQHETAELNAMLEALRQRDVQLGALEERVASLAEWVTTRAEPEALAFVSEIEAACKALRARREAK